MLRVVLLLLLVVNFSSCIKEQVQKKVEDLVVQVMVDGVWEVSKYQEDTTDMTAPFVGWECRFLENRTCTATKGSTIVSGTWDGSYADQTMSGHFGNIEPLIRMNGTWKIIRSTYTTGQFERLVNGKVFKLEIKKK